MVYAGARGASERKAVHFILVEDIITDVDIEARSLLFRLLRIFDFSCCITAMLLNLRCEGDVMVQELAPLHHHLTDGLLVIDLLKEGKNILLGMILGSWDLGIGQFCVLCEVKN